MNKPLNTIPIHLLSFEYRKNACIRIKQKFPNKIPVILIPRPNSEGINLLKRNFIIEPDTYFSKLYTEIRSVMDETSLKTYSSKGIYLFINGQTIHGMITFGELYEKYADKDGFLYVVYTSENTFG